MKKLTVNQDIRQTIVLDLMVQFLHGDVAVMLSTALTSRRSHGARTGAKIWA